MDRRSGERITIYSDYVCPFCYLGRRALSAYQETRETELEIDWRPFDLRAQKRGPDGEIDHSIEDGKDDAYFEEVQENVARLRERYGAEGMLDLADLPEVDSLNAQVASHYVDETHPESWRAFDEAIFEALWIEGRDVGDADVLAGLAADVGLDGDEIRETLSEASAREDVFEAFERARRQGVTGVPTFVYEGHAARGAVPPEQLKRLVEGT